MLNIHGIASLLSVLGVSGHMFTGVLRGLHSVKVTCTSRGNSSLTASSTVSGLQFLEVILELKSFVKNITVLINTSIPATHRCKLDDSSFVECKPLIK